jgi:S-DNA-T family DNA segregation ATPase FtsK/SpoIIIE
MKRAATSQADHQQMTPLLWRRLQEGGFILLSALAIFLCVALISYHEADPGWSHTTTSQMIQNKAGQAGAWFSDLCFYLFGYIAYMIPTMIACAGIQLFQGRAEFRGLNYFQHWLWSFRVLGFVLAVLSGCGLANLHFNVFHLLKLPVSAGGVVGQLISEKLTPVLGYLGGTLSLMAVFLTGITLATGLSWFGLMDILSQILVNNVRLFCSSLVAMLYKIKQYRFRQFFERKTPAPVIKVKRITPVLTERALNKTTNIEAPLSLKSKGVEDKKFKVSVRATSSVSSSSFFNTELPDINLLEEVAQKDVGKAFSANKLETLSREVEARLLEFGAEVNVVAVYPGPVITRFELELAAGLKISKISGLSKDLARALSVNSVRVVEVIPGKSVIGIEIPNEDRALVRLKEILRSAQYEASSSPLSLALGKDISGEPAVVNLAKMPHLLVAGTTGSGKSVGINVMLLSLLYKATPKDVRLILIDPKMLELSIYDGIPHLLTPVVTDMKDAANALRWCVAEMERRYQLMAALGVRNLVGYNHKIAQAGEEKKLLLDPLWQPGSSETQPCLNKLPYIVVIIDEFADMMMVVGKKVEELIARIAQKARAAGIHLILATQRPSVDVITGLIKANVPTRIAFQVSSRIDSRTILDQQGAEQLLGYGDMLYLAPGAGIPLRIHGAFVSDEEVHRVVKALKQLGEPDYTIDVLGNNNGMRYSGSEGFEEEIDGEQDDLYDKAVQIVAESRRASISHLQRRLKVGYNRAARLIETMETAGIVSNIQSNGGREVLVSEPQSD